MPVRVLHLTCLTHATQHTSTRKNTHNTHTLHTPPRFRRLALKYHPDCNKDEDSKDEFARVCEAYDVLSDREWISVDFPHRLSSRWALALACQASLI